MGNSPDSSITKLYEHAVESRLPYVRHYMKLHNDFADEHECFNFYDDLYKKGSAKKIRNKAQIDPDGILGTYLNVNPILENPTFYTKHICNEYNRLVITKYRVGAHHLKI